MKGRKNTAGILRHRLTLQEEIKISDGAGGYIRSWSDVGNVWAEISSLGNRSTYGQEKLFAEQIQAEITHRLFIRYRSIISTDMRLLFENRIFNIRTIRNINESNEMLELLVEEGAEN